ncbi:SWIM zinc finger family protein [Streptomyces sp. NPDC056716]|uniref:SWIM zinc finger family protein n=1 Tax=unclassified Streptomyces TaxID=2593676 RepID=UPI0036B5571C
MTRAEEARRAEARTADSARIEGAPGIGERAPGIEEAARIEGAARIEETARIEGAAPTEAHRPTGSSPAEAARRALRAARERGSGDGERGDDAAEGVRGVRPPRPGGPGPRPGDAARAALREAVSARRAQSAGDDVEGEPGEGPGGRPQQGAPSGTAAQAPAVPRPGGTRPSEAAREALRLALAEERATEGEAVDRTKRTGAVQRTAGGGSAEPRAKGADPAPHRAISRLLTPSRKDPAPAPPAAPHHPTDLPPEPPPTPSTPATSLSTSATPSTSATSSPTSATPSTSATSSSTPATPVTSSSTPVTPSAPSTPSMASPRRDGDHRRTFPALPPRPVDDGGFAGTWWGNAWVSALEEGALDAKRLARGRGYAERGHVDAITVTPGLVLAYVQGSRQRPYRVQVRLRTLEDADWERFLDAAAERPAHIAALLDKEMPHALAEGEVRLLPAAGDLEPQCSCPDRAHPCKHAAALCYQTARLLDADPFVLLLLRGRGEREVLDALSRRSAARAARAAQEREPAPLPGVRATEALARRALPPLPPPLPVPPHPGQPPAYPASPGGPDPFALDQLATDAAARAYALLATGRDPVADLTVWQDAVRLAAARPGSGLTASTRALYSSLASAAGRTSAELARAVAAWRQGGFEGLAVLEEPWDPPAGRFDRARPLLLAADLPAFRPWRNRLTHPRGRVQLRLGRDGLWYAYESEPGADDWWPRGTPDLDPVGALTGLGGQ